MTVFIIERHAEIDSTNLEAMRRGKTGVRDLAIIADAQSAGRGRHGRNWDSPSGNLFLSILTQPDISPCRLGELAFVAAIAVADAIDNFVPAVALKWPNDILLQGKKLGGILIENELTCDRVDFSVIGIGINVASKPEETRYPATCLAEHGADCSRDDIADAVLTAFAHRCDEWQRDGFTTIRANWMKRAWNLGAPIAIETDKDIVSGTFDGIDGNGGLLLATDQGEKTIVSGTLSYFPLPGGEVGRPLGDDRVRGYADFQSKPLTRPAVDLSHRER